MSSGQNSALNGRSPGSYNDEGLEGLSDRRSAGPAPQLSPAQKAELARMVREGPDPAVDGVLRWCRVDLQRRIEARLAPQDARANRWQATGKLGISPALGVPAALEVRPRNARGFQKTSPQRKPTCCRNVAATNRWMCGSRSEPDQERLRGSVFPANARVGQQGMLTRIRADRGSRPRAPRDTRYTWAYIFGAV